MKKKVRVNKVGRSLKAVPREDATLEAEKGETILTNLSEDGIPEFYDIKGSSHANGGTPLKATPGSFIFSKDKKMYIKDPDVLKEFGYKNPKKSGYSPAEISRKFNNSKARETLVDEMADKTSIETAEKLIANYNEKHGLLAFVQESQKGFPTGIPKVSMAYLDAAGIDIEELTKAIEGSKNQQGEPQAPQQQMRYGGIPKAQDGYSVEDKKNFDRLIYDYTANNNRAGTNFNFNDKEIDLKSGKYNEVMNPIKLKGKNYDRPYFDDKRVSSDSTNVIPGVPPEYAQAFWSESGNFVPIGSGAQGYTDKYIKTYKKGKSGAQRYVTNIWDDEANYDELPTRQTGGDYQAKLDFNSQMAKDSINITPGTQNINQLDLNSRDTNLTTNYDWSKDYKPKYDGNKKVAHDDALNPRKAELNNELNTLRRKMAGVYGVPTRKDGMPDYTQMDVNQVYDKSLMDPEDLKSMYGIMNEKRAIRDAQGFQRKQYYGDKEAEQRGYNRDTPLEDLDLGIRFMTGVQNKELQSLQEGGESTRKRKTKAPKGSVVWDVNAKDFNPNDVMNGDYVVVDGVVKKVDNLRKSELEGSDYKDERLGKMQSTYGSLAKRLENKDVREKLYDDYIKKIKGSKLSASDKDRLISLSEDDVIESFLKQQQQVAIIDNRGGIRDKETGELLSDVEAWDRGAGDKKNQKYKDFVSKNNMDELSEDEIKVSQAVYQSLDSLKEDPLFSDFRIAPTGVQDENYKEGNISEIEGFAGNTLMGQAVGVIAPNEYDTSDLDYEDEVIEEEPQNLNEVAAQRENPFWLQDDVNLIGAIGDRFSLKKQTPLELTGNVSIPNPTFYSPDQAIQNRLSSMKTATEGAKAFGSAADYANFANFAQGKTASQVANDIAQVQNQNVGISNDFAVRKANLKNQDSAIKAQSKVREWDKRNLVDANYDNSARASNAEIRKMFNNRWTNRGMTQTLNERDDQFDVDARTGFTNYTGVEKQLDPSKVQADIFDTASKIMETTGMEPKDAYDYAMKLRGIGSSSSKSSPSGYPGRG